MYVGYQQIDVLQAGITSGDLTIPPSATHAELRVETQSMRYIMDSKQSPTNTRGMLMLTTDEPKTFLIEDIKRIRAIRTGGGDAVLNIHYFGGREI